MQDTTQGRERGESIMVISEQYKFNNKNTGISDQTTTFKNRILEKWFYKTEEFSVQYSASLNMPIIDNDGTVYIGAEDYNNGIQYYAFNPDGSLKWRNASISNDNGGVYGSAISDSDGQIYIPTNDYLTALDRSGGKQWEYNTVGRVKPPVLDNDGTIYSGSSGSVFALNPDGTEKWKSNININRLKGIAFDGSDLYITSADGNTAGYLKKVSTVDGSVLWSTSLGSPGEYGAPILSDAIYLSDYDGNLREFDYSGNEIWSYSPPDLNNSSTSAPSIDSDFNIYYCISYYDGSDYRSRIYSVDSSGNERWYYEFEGTGERGTSPIIDDNDNIITAGPNGVVYIFDQDGTRINSITVDGVPYQDGPAISSDSTLYIGTNQGVTALTNYTIEMIEPLNGDTLTTHYIFTDWESQGENWNATKWHDINFIDVGSDEQYTHEVNSETVTITSRAYLSTEDYKDTFVTIFLDDDWIRIKSPQEGDTVNSKDVPVWFEWEDSNGDFQLEMDDSYTVTFSSLEGYEHIYAFEDLADLTTHTAYVEMLDSTNSIVSDSATFYIDTSLEWSLEVYNQFTESWEEKDYNHFEIHRGNGRNIKSPTAKIKINPKISIERNDRVRLLYQGKEKFRGYAPSNGRIDEEGYKNYELRGRGYKILQQEVSVSLTSTNPANILEECFKDTNWEVDVESTGITIDSYDVISKRKKIVQEMLDRSGYVFRVDTVNQIFYFESYDRGENIQQLLSSLQGDQFYIKEWEEDQMDTIVNEVTVKSPDGTYSSTAFGSSNLGYNRSKTYYVDYINSNSEASELALARLNTEPDSYGDVVVGGARYDPKDWINAPFRVLEQSRNINKILVCNKMVIYEDYMELKLGKSEYWGIQEARRKNYSLEDQS